MAAKPPPLPARITRLGTIAALLVPASLMAGACSSGDTALNDKLAASEAAAKRAEAAADRAEAAARKSSGSPPPAMIEESEPETVRADAGETQDQSGEETAQTG